MNINFKRLGSLFLALVLLLSGLPAEVLAGNFSYKQIIDSKYEGAKNFSEGLAPVKKDGKWGYIDEDDNLVIDFIYDEAHSFRENKAVVATKKLDKNEWSGDYYENLYWGVIDRYGNYKPFKFSSGDVFTDMVPNPDNFVEDFVIPNSSGTRYFYFNDVVAISRFDDPGIYMFDGNGRELFSRHLPVTRPTEGVLALYDGYMDLAGNRLYEDKDLQPGWNRPFNQGLAAVKLGTNDYYNLMDKKGKIYDEFKMKNYHVHGVNSFYQLFNDNSLMSMENLNGRWGAVNKEAQTVVPFKYDMLHSFQEGVAGFKRNGKFGFIDIEANEIIKPEFDQVTSFNNGLAVVAKGDRAYIIDKKGQIVEGSDKIPKDNYFVDDGHGGYTLYSPGKYVLTNEGSKFGFGEIIYRPNLPGLEDMSSWALDEVILAIEQDLVPVNLQNMYRTDITRVDFAGLVVKAIEKVKGQDIDAILRAETGKGLYELVADYPFKDTNDYDVIAAQALNIINGRGHGEFDPLNTISRQESAALLMRTGKFLGDKSKVEDSKFVDQKNISTYAKEAVNYVSSVGVMQGIENNQFAPHSNYTREQAYMTIYRLFNVLVD